MDQTLTATDLRFSTRADTSKSEPPGKLFGTLTLMMGLMLGVTPPLVGHASPHHHNTAHTASSNRSPAHAHAHAAGGAHVHGHGHMLVDMRADGSGKVVLDVRLEVPAEALFGFEHPPRTDAHRQTVHKAIDLLKQAGTVLQIAEGACQLIAPPVVDLPWPLAPKPSNQPANADPSKTDNQHADVLVSVQVACGQRPSQAQTKVFAAFGRLRQVTATVIDQGGQRSVKLTPQATSLKLSR